jgi:hypothetical protein
LLILCLNKYNFSIFSSKFRSDSISKRELIITLGFDSISKWNVAFYSSCSVHKRKIKQQRSVFLFSKGKKGRNFRFFIIESKKRIDFVHKKTKRSDYFWWVDSSWLFLRFQYTVNSPFFFKSTKIQISHYSAEIWGVIFIHKRPIWVFMVKQDCIWS